jgi:hypothetical protein
MYNIKENLIFGFHGCDETLCDELVCGKKVSLSYSENAYDWLGKGMYFWENDPERALEWAKNLIKHKQNKNQNIMNPAVLGAVICLGHCLDFLEKKNLDLLKKHYFSVKEQFTSNNIALPQNSGGKDLYKRELDCFLINSLVVKQREDDPENAYDSVRGVFFEGQELYPNAGFREKDHMQIAIINPNCIKAFFKLRKEDKKFHSV